MKQSSAQCPQGFTLIELVVVMTLLSVVLAIAAPRLGRFMSGRDIVEEGRRLVAATRFARSEAIARNRRMEVWFDMENNMYGVRPEAAYLQDEEKVIEFTLADKLAFVIDEDQTELNEEGEAIILFWPDGTIDTTSLREITLTEEGEPRKRLAIAANRMDYSLEDAVNEER